MGFFDIPVVKRSPNGILALVLCILLGGIGTIIVGAIDNNPANSKKNIILLGVIQLVLSFVLIGWVWALIWGIIVFVRSVPETASTPAPAAAAPPPRAPAKKAAKKAAKK